MYTFKYNYEARDGREVEIEIEFSIENDGIGCYEYGSQRCFDKGTDYPTDFMVTGIDEENEDLRGEIEAWLDSRKGSEAIYESALAHMEILRGEAAADRAERRAED